MGWFRGRVLALEGLEMEVQKGDENDFGPVTADFRIG